MFSDQSAAGHEDPDQSNNNPLGALRVTRGAGKYAALSPCRDRISWRYVDCAAVLQGQIETLVLAMQHIVTAKVVTLGGRIGSHFGALYRFLFRLEALPRRSVSVISSSLQR